MAKLQKNVNSGSKSGSNLGSKSVSNSGSNSGAIPSPNEGIKSTNNPSPNEGSNQGPTSGGSRKKSKKSRSWFIYFFWKKIGNQHFYSY